MCNRHASLLKCPTSYMYKISKGESRAISNELAEKLLKMKWYFNVACLNFFSCIFKCLFCTNSAKIIFSYSNPKPNLNPKPNPKPNITSASCKEDGVKIKRSCDRIMSN